MRVTSRGAFQYIQPFMKHLLCPNQRAIKETLFTQKKGLKQRLEINPSEMFFLSFNSKMISLNFEGKKGRDKKRGDNFFPSAIALSLVPGSPFCLLKRPSQANSDKFV